MSMDFILLDGKAVIHWVDTTAYKQINAPYLSFSNDINSPT